MYFSPIKIIRKKSLWMIFESIHEPIQNCPFRSNDELPMIDLLTSFAEDYAIV